MKCDLSFQYPFSAKISSARGLAILNRSQGILITYSLSSCWNLFIFHRVKHQPTGRTFYGTQLLLLVGGFSGKEKSRQVFKLSGYLKVNSYQFFFSQREEWCGKWCLAGAKSTGSGVQSWGFCPGYTINNLWLWAKFVLRSSWITIFLFFPLHTTIIEIQQ